MKLKKIHFAGFKSFVDSTGVTLPANIIGIVGPNGCGKSNVIDAIRWVMGESSAKTLRGDQMADVIFNGSSTRKPVSRASVELLFDNANGKAPGAYAKFSEISVKRVLSRDGQSDYYLNNVKCRRKDITDLFLGTGLGPRSYSIIEQGMVSKIVEAKPEELRNFIEEAAGVSKYKERRRETENRIRHTRENLERVGDIRQELDSQLSKLQRQAQRAKKYKEISAKKNQLEVETFSLEWQKVSNDLSTYDVELAKDESTMERYISVQREKEALIQELRSDQQSSQDKLNQVQGNFYRLSADITAIEQKLQFGRENKVKLDQEYQRYEQDILSLNEQIQNDQSIVEECEIELEIQIPLLEELEESADLSKRSLEEHELKLSQWQMQWDTFIEQSRDPETEKNIQQAKIQQLQASIDGLKEQDNKLDYDLESITFQEAGIDLVLLKEEELEKSELVQSLQIEYEEISESIRKTKQDQIQLDENLSNKRHRKHDLSGKISSLNELQKAAMGSSDEDLKNWIESNKLDELPRLASLVEIEQKWEKAFDTVIGTLLTGFCVNQEAKVNSNITDAIIYSEEEISFDSTMFSFDDSQGESWNNNTSQDLPLLSQYVNTKVDLTPWLNGIYVANNQQEVEQFKSKLLPHEFIVLSNGCMIGKSWVKMSKSNLATNGLVSREKSLVELNRQLEESLEEICSLEIALQNKRQSIEDLELKKNDLQLSLNENKAGLINTQERLKVETTRQQDLVSRRSELAEHKKSNEGKFELLTEEIQEAHERVEIAIQMTENLGLRREELLVEKEDILSDLASFKESTEGSQQKNYEVRLKVQSLKDKLLSHQKSLERNLEQQSILLERKAALVDELERFAMPDSEEQEQLLLLLEEKQIAEQELALAKDKLSGFENSLIEQSQYCQQAIMDAQNIRDGLEKKRLKRHEWVIQQRNLQLKIEQLGCEVEIVLSKLDEHTSYESSQEQLQEINQKLNQLGTVNLLAIEEYEEQSQRKVYLDKQNDDLVAAMDILESAIAKIDRETKERFKITYEMLNDGFQKIFPQLFGGGSASLQLTDNDFLRTGVAVIARPPGKRNSTIHLLSGGEKALTAVALLFSLFQLSPAPFCILDEVDAPLDDANVERYCRILKQMSTTTQLLFITHNKITMEIADLLLGVTMQESGVSKVVSVDVEKAVEMVG